jgi:hypothetical protein
MKMSPAGKCLCVLTLLLLFVVLPVSAQTCAPRPGLISCWDGDARSGTTATDLQDGNNGTIFGGVTAAPGNGNVQNAFQFDGSTGRIEMGNPANLNFGPAGPFSVEAWFVWPGGGSSINNIIRKSNYPVTGPGAGYWLRIGRDSNVLEFFTGDAVGTGAPFGVVSIPLNPRNCHHHIVGTRDSNGVMNLYLDGELKGTTQASDANTTSEAPFVLGAWDDRFGVIELFSGLIDQAAVYNRALDPSEIQAIFNAGGAGKCQVCGQPKITRPDPGTLSNADWNLTYQVTDQDGLELDDVSLATRYMAKEINLPYFRLQTTNFPPKRCTLTPDGDPTQGLLCTSRLVNFETSQPGAGLLEIKADYEVDNVSTQFPNACLLITQDYQFSPPNPLGCEPSNTLICARFKPIVSYEFVPGDPSETLASINTAQRLHFAVDLPNPDLFDHYAETSAVFKDCDVPLCSSGHTIFQDKENPLDTELYANAITNGEAGRWDNFHQTFKGHVLEPLYVDGTPPLIKRAGCPECVHIHWRWGIFLTYLSHVDGNGFPIVPPGSNQDVNFAVVRWHAGEEDPEDFTSLVNGESLLGFPMVLWYSATGYLNSDSFFIHGGFFGPNYPGPH